MSTSGWLAALVTLFVLAVLLFPEALIVIAVIAVLWLLGWMWLGGSL